MQKRKNLKWIAREVAVNLFRKKLQWKNSKDWQKPLISGSNEPFCAENRQKASMEKILCEKALEIPMGALF
ncbi:MAG: hypothetical protein B6U68_02115 [Candidatus Aenigmarchaeota archaeon ex4484_14]|nr:MAG: hypothetical protein B6U68_02115 [Candidatus Aenigmarchaeota archaeon ex4484_14]RLJ04666.1 MAG: hypothetical protein DRP08_01180 [Candidatus Aenigmarchaeota archaeon]